MKLTKEQFEQVSAAIEHYDRFVLGALAEDPRRPRSERKQFETKLTRLREARFKVQAWFAANGE